MCLYYSIHRSVASHGLAHYYMPAIQTLITMHTILLINLLSSFISEVIELHVLAPRVFKKKSQSDDGIASVSGN